jgi:hypothetical protein
MQQIASSIRDMKLAFSLLICFDNWDNPSVERTFYVASNLVSPVRLYKSFAFPDDKHAIFPVLNFCIKNVNILWSTVSKIFRFKF